MTALSSRDADERPCGSACKIVRDGLSHGATLRGAVIVLGNFDGFHLGHQLLIRCAHGLAQGRRPVAVMSVEPHPRQVFSPAAAPFRLALPAQKHGIAAGLGLDFIYEPRFDPAFAALTPTEFVAGILAGRLGVRHVVVGADFRFGAGRAGTTETLAELCPAVGIGVTVLPLQAGYSSTAARGAILRGSMTEAGRILGRPWQAALTPQGRIAPEQICPPPGSYLVRSQGLDPQLARLTRDRRLISARPLPASVTFLDRRA